MDKITIKFQSFFVILEIILFTVIISCKETVTQIKSLNNDESDAITIEALPPSRGNKQFNYHNVYWVNALSEGNPCLTSKGSLGYCSSFRHCYPYLKLPDITLWESWILGNYDTCTYFNSDARQLLGVCCTNPPSIPPSLSSDTPITDNQVEGDMETINGQSKDSMYQRWPPSVPTYPLGTTTKRPVSVVQWPPPIPTHPPDHHYPTHPTKYPSSIPSTTTTTTKKPGFDRPSTIAWPPPIPTHSPTSTTIKPVYPTPTTTSSPVTSNGFQASCGAKNGVLDEERIVGGQNASPNEWPWMVVLFNGGRQFCGGSLIDSSHVLTAAHCVAHMTSWDVARLKAHLGDHNIRSNTEVRHVERKIKRVVRHKGFDFRTLYNDVAILTLDKPVKFTNAIRPICLPSLNAKAYSGKVGTVAGWGSLRENGPQPAVLQKVSVPIWTNRECSRKYGPAAPAGITESMICAGQAAKDSCSGDSGGPLMVAEGSRWVQVGVVSWGIGCGKGQYPGVYTRVSSFLPWIMKNTSTK